MDKNLMHSPAEEINKVDLPAGYKGGPGTYDGIKGYPERTSSPNAVPEKVIDAQPPLKSGKE